MVNALAVIEPPAPLPAIVTCHGEKAAWRFLGFFTVNIRNPHTRVAYSRAAGRFLVKNAHRSKVVIVLSKTTPMSHLVLRSSAGSPDHYHVA